MRVFGGGVFEGRLGHEDRTLMNGTGTLTKETPERFIAPSAM